MTQNTQSLIKHLASTVQARLNCRSHGNPEWAAKHTDSIKQLLGYLPSGSGVDNGTTIDLDRSTGSKIVLIAGFHHMNEHGYYDGWTEHTITVRPSFIGDVTLTISGRDRNAIKEYLHELYQYALTQDVTHTAEGYQLTATIGRDAWTEAK